ncbi:hypothetical protein GMOD_00004110 [Pyrenophora seminiperda CCB06]|uniref:Ankyrin repeat n=1 Tax=Pyrenophora seminiperda CCB06 TaxID=1302712 RepID=A0A3M7M0L7_9PLEO|nr:hypothetical protein GMOD_00004110 [Pyrenophora seminiperda CCB06]
MVVWCLEHGATFDLVDRRKRGEPILERVAASGDIQTFDLLRSKGAPLGERVLHRAVEAATFGKPDPANAEKDTEYQRKERISHIKCMHMVRHLLHEVHLDVNAPDQPEGSNFPDCKGPPICYIASYAGIERDTRELTWLLLDQGADPKAGLEEARLMEYPKLAEDIKAWKAKQSRWGKCCVQ